MTSVCRGQFAKLFLTLELPLPIFGEFSPSPPQISSAMQARLDAPMIVQVVVHLPPLYLESVNAAQVGFFHPLLGEGEGSPG